MSAKIDYLRSQLSGLNAQLAADNGKSTVLQLLGKANALLAARTELGEEPVRDKVEQLVTAIHAATTAYNANNNITVDAVADIMAGYDAAVDPDPDAPNTPA